MIYFAYGSNMLRERLVERIDDVEDLGVARLDGYSMAFDKDGRDGSGKCTIARGDSSDRVWGVLFGMDESQRVILDDFEGPDYGIHDINVVQGSSAGADGEPQVVSAFVYIAHYYKRDSSRRPWVWYRDLVLAGAVQNKLPKQYIARIRAIDCSIDPDADRHQRNTDLVHQAGMVDILVNAAGTDIPT